MANRGGCQAARASLRIDIVVLLSRTGLVNHGGGGGNPFGERWAREGELSGLSRGNQWLAVGEREDEALMAWLDQRMSPSASTTRQPAAASPGRNTAATSANTARWAPRGSGQHRHAIEVVEALVAAEALEAPAASTTAPSFTGPVAGTSPLPKVKRRSRCLGLELRQRRTCLGVLALTNRRWPPPSPASTPRQAQCSRVPERRRLRCRWRPATAATD